MAGFDQFSVTEGATQSGADFAQLVIDALNSTLHLSIAANQALSLRQWITASFSSLVVSEVYGFSSGRRSSGSSSTYRVLCPASMAADPQRSQLLVTTIKVSLNTVNRGSWIDRSNHKYEAFITAARFIVSHDINLKGEL